MATAVVMKPSADPVVSLAKRTFCIKLVLSRLGNSRRVNASEVKVDSDVSMLRISKRLLDSPELKAVRNFDGEVRRYLQSICLPFEIGIHLCPVALFMQVEEKLQEMQKERKVLVKKFLDAYPKLIPAAKKRLRKLYNANDYPPLETVAAQFDFYWQYISFDVPEQIKGISRQVWEKERDKAQKRMAEATQEIQLVLRQSLLQLVKHITDRLKTDKEGKPLVFRDSLVGNLTEFLGNFEFRNVTDDAQLQTIVKQARDLLAGVEPDQLRDIGTVRKKVEAGMEKVAAQLEKMTARAGRKFRFK